MLTKWEIMQAQKAELAKKLEELTAHLEWAERTPFVANGTGECSKCRQVLPTEADFWKHFLIPDERYLNLGECPNDPKLKDKVKEYPKW